MENANLLKGLRSQLKSPAEIIDKKNIKAQPAKAVKALPTKSKENPIEQIAKVAKGEPVDSDQVAIGDVLKTGFVAGIDKKGQLVLMVVGDKMTDIEKYAILHHIQLESSSMGVARGLNAIGKAAQLMKQQAQPA